MASIATENARALESSVANELESNALLPRPREAPDSKSQILLDLEDEDEVLQNELSSIETDCTASTTASTDNGSDSNPQKLYNARNWANHIDSRPIFNNYLPSVYLQQQLLKQYDPVIDRLSRHEVVEHFNVSHKVGPIPLHALPYDAAELCVCANKVRSFVNKVKHAVKCVTWTPNAERIIVCNQAGEMTLWEGKGFQFDSIVQAHDQSIETMRWARKENLLLTGDTGGFVKMWQPNLNCVYAAAMHGARVTSIAWSPTDRLFATSSDDVAQPLVVWDLFTMSKLRQLPTGKRRGIRCMDWNSCNSVLLAASREIENGLCLFDARTGEAENHIAGLNAAILTLEWHPHRENYWLAGGKDRCVRLYDLRMLDATRGVVAQMRCDSDVTKLRWHPAHSEIFLSGEGDGSISYWHTRNLLGNDARHTSPKAQNLSSISASLAPTVSPASSGAILKLSAAHDAYVRDIAIHPLGHLLVTAGGNGVCSVWSRLALSSAPPQSNQKNHAGAMTLVSASKTTPSTSRKRSIATALAASDGSETPPSKKPATPFTQHNSSYPAYYPQSTAMQPAQLNVHHQRLPLQQIQQLPIPTSSINYYQSNLNFSRVPYFPLPIPLDYQSGWPILQPASPHAPWPPRLMTRFHLPSHSYNNINNLFR